MGTGIYDRELENQLPGVCLIEELDLDLDQDLCVCVHVCRGGVRDKEEEVLSRSTCHIDHFFLPVEVSCPHLLLQAYNLSTLYVPSCMDYDGITRV